MALAEIDPQFIPRKSLEKFEAFRSSSPALDGMTVARYRIAKPLPGLTKPNAQEASFMVVLPLRRISSQYVFCGGRPRKVTEHRPSTLSIFDLRESWTSEMTQPLDTINVFVPQRAINEVTDGLGASRIGHLTTGADFIVSDVTMFGLAQAMVPVLASASKPSRLFLDHVLSAMCVHLAVRYGDIDLSRARPVGGLAPWREKRAKDLMTARLSDDLSIAELADACGISPRHFERAFRKNTGETPHYWRMKRRIERAKALLTEGRLELSEISLVCGFSDQSHLGRVFTKFVGCTPNEYRHVGIV